MTDLQKKNQGLYRKELNRLKAQERRMIKRGYTFTTPEGDYVGFVPKSKPSRITKQSIDRLKKISGEAYYKKGFYIEPETGKLTSAKTGRKLERKRSARKSLETRKERELDEAEIDYQIPPPSVRDIEELYKKQSQLKKYGGWIEDHKKANSTESGMYVKEVDNMIFEAVAFWSGLSRKQRWIATRYIENYLEAQYGYDASLVKSDVVEQFKSARNNLYALHNALKAGFLAAKRQ